MSNTSDSGGELTPPQGIGASPLSGNDTSAEIAVGKQAAKAAEALAGLIGPINTAINKLNKSTNATPITSRVNQNAGSFIPVERSGDLTSRPAHMATYAATMASGGRSTGGGGGGGFDNGFGAGRGAGGGAANAAQIATQIAGAINSALNSRIERGYQYSLAADRMSVMYQQMTGMSQSQVQSAYRQPLTNYRLGGPEGINTLLGMQARTGISAAGQASSVEALRTISGYGFSTEDASRMISTLGSAQVANRMFMTMGTSLYGIGGKQNSTMSVIQSAVRAAGLTDARMLAGAAQQGSATRARLSFMGVPEDMQDMVIQYAKENLAFNKKGGRGMYDPSKKEDRKLMGVEENFATQKEETERLKTRREENFYRRQADNFADLEKVTQRLTTMFGALEEKLSGIIGAKISSGPAGKVAGGMMKSAGSAMLTAGLMTGTTPIGWGLMLAGGLSLAGSAIFGDPPDPDGKPTGGTKNATSEAVSKMQQASSFKKLHPTMQQRITKMVIASGGRVGFGGGYRDTGAQEQMFRSRYSVVSDADAIKRKDYDYFWDGKYWKHTSGAPAAPPGRSMHEIGLAADMTGDMDWIVANAAKFGLKHFKDVNGEAWHVQPNELPNSRTKYEKLGSPWGNGGGPTASESAAGGRQGSADTMERESSGGYATTTGIAGKSISEIIDSIHRSNVSSLGSSVGAGGLSYKTGATTPTQAYSDGVLSGTEMVKLLKAAGFSGQDLINAVAISHRESHWNPRAFNGNTSTGDKSYGLFQINMLDKPGYMLGESRRKQFGLSKNEELFDPSVNARVTKQMVDSGGWNPWGGYKGMSNTYNTDLAKAAATIKAAESGDGIVPDRSGPVGGNTVVHGGTSITIAPEIHMHGGSGSNADLRNIAKEVGRLIKQELDLTLLRSR